MSLDAAKGKGESSVVNCDTKECPTRYNDRPTLYRYFPPKGGNSFSLPQMPVVLCTFP